MALRDLLETVPLLLLVLLAAAIDVRWRRIPNWLTFGLVAAGLGRAALTGHVGSSVAGIIAGAAAPFVLFVIGAAGGGDVKLMAGIGAWLGPEAAVAVFAVEKVMGVVIVLCQAAMQRKTAALIRNSAILVGEINREGLFASRAADSFSSIGRPLPFAVPTALATVLVILGPLWV